MSQVNLLPVEVRQRQHSRRVTAAVLASAAVVVGLLIFVYSLQVSRVSETQRQLETQQSVNSRLQTRIDALRRFTEVKQQVADRQALLTQVTQGQIAWSGVLKDISSVMPGQMWLTSLTATEAGATPTGQGGTEAVSGSGVVATIQFVGTAFNHRTVALWLTRVEQVKGWANSWVTSSAKGQSQLGGDFVTFSGSVDVTAGAISNRGPS
jgi:Tfp pilus assembly protein PilN